MSEELKSILKKFPGEYKVKYLVDSMERVNNFENDIKNNIVSKGFDINIIEKRFKIPDEYLNFVRLVSSIDQSFGDGSYWSVIHGAKKCLSTTESMYEKYQKDKEYGLAGEADEIFINIGFWTDKHEYLLSCDRDRNFGKVFDCWNDNFYNATKENMFSVYEEFDSFYDFLISGLF